MAQITSALRRLRLPDLGRWAQVVALLLLLGLLVAMAVGPIGQLIEQRSRMSDLAADLDSVEENNRLLDERIERLQDPDYIEQKAREQGGLVRPGEISIVVMQPGEKEAAKEKKKRSADAAPAPEPEPGVIERFATFLGF